MKHRPRITRLLHHLLTPRTATQRAFPDACLKQIAQQISQGEVAHHAEIRFVVEHALDWSAVWAEQSPRQRAIELFSTLGIWDTANNTGILIYVNLADHQVEILADRGVNQYLTASHWQPICQQLTQGYAQGEYSHSTLTAIQQLNQLLAQALPRQSHQTPSNELPNKPLLL